MRKRNSNAKLFSLEEGQQAQLAEWLLDGVPYHKARELTEKEFGVSVSLGAFTSFYQDVCVPLLLQRRSRAVATAKEIGADARSRPGEFSGATIDLLEQKALELAIAPNVDPRNVKALYSLVLKARDQGLEERRISLDREKFEFTAAEACLKKLPELRAVAADNGLDRDAKLKVIRETLFGEVPEGGPIT